MGPRITLTKLNKNWKREQVNKKQEIKKQGEINESKRQLFGINNISNT